MARHISRFRPSVAIKKGDAVRVKGDYRLPSIRGQEGIVIDVGNTGTMFVKLNDMELNYKLSPWGGGMASFQWFELEGA